MSLRKLLTFNHKEKKIIMCMVLGIMMLMTTGFTKTALPEDWHQVTIVADGKTIIENAAKEPHVVDFANFLNSMGANIKGAGTDVIRIKGVSELHGTEYTIIPDQIEAGTFMVAAAATMGDVTVKNVIPKHLESISAKLVEMGCQVQESDDAVRVVANKRLQKTNVKTLPYPGFPTDLQQPLTSLLALANGTSTITETVL